MSPVDLEDHPVDRVNYKRFHKYLVSEGILSVAGRPSTQGSVSLCDFLLSVEGKFPVCSVDILGDQVD